MPALNFGIAALLLPAALAIPVQPLRRDDGGSCGPSVVTVTCPAPSTVYITASLPTLTVSALSTSPAGAWGAAPTMSTSSSSIVQPVYSSSTTALGVFPTGSSDSTSSTTANSWPTSVSGNDTLPTSLSAWNTTSTASTTIPSSSPVGPGSIGSKRGIMIPADDPSDTAAYVKAFGANTSKISWTSNFYSGAPKDLSPAISFVPQRYHTATSDDQDWIFNANKAVSAGEKYLFAYGEPSLKGDPPLDPITGADSWKKQLQPWTANATVGAPTMLSTDADFEWLENFIQACTGCDIGFTTMHWINKVPAGGAANSFKNFQTVVANATAVAHRISPSTPLWVDNILADGAPADVKEFLSQAIPWLDANPDVFRYAYFSQGSSSPSSFITPDGQLTALGSYYANL